MGDDRLCKRTTCRGARNRNSQHRIPARRTRANSVATPPDEEEDRPIEQGRTQTGERLGECQADIPRIVAESSTQSGELSTAMSPATMNATRMDMTNRVNALHLRDLVT